MSVIDPAPLLPLCGGLYEICTGLEAGGDVDGREVEGEAVRSEVVGEGLGVSSLRWEGGVDEMDRVANGAADRERADRRG